MIFDLIRPQFISPDGNQSVDEIINLLRNDDRLDWSHYLEVNADVATFNMDPVKHYIYYGVKEGRQLPVLPLEEGVQSVPGRSKPILTMVISHSGDINFLDKSVRSCIGQSSRKLELLIFSPGNTDLRSIDVDRYKDANIRILFHKTDASPSSVEYLKQALALAEGNYLLFISSGDFLDSHLCQNLERICGSAPDIVALNTCVLTASAEGIRVDTVASDACNQEGNQDLHGAQIMEAAYGSCKLIPSISNKAYNKNKLLEALGSIPDIPSGFMQTCLPLALLNNAKSLKYSSECKLYSFVNPKDSCTPSISASLDEIGNYLKICKDILATQSQQQYYNYFFSQILGIVISSVLAMNPNCDNNDLMPAIRYFGIIPVLNHLINNYFHEWMQVAAHSKWNTSLSAGLKPGSRVGIIYPVILNGGAENILIEFSNLLIDNGYEVVMFLERPSQNESKLKEGINIRYVGVADYKAPQIVARIQQLYTYIQRDNVDIMISHAYWSPALLWESILFHSLEIPYIVFQHSSFYRRLITQDNDYGILESEAALRCVDKLFVLSTYDEAYLRNRGIDAVYIPNPVRTGTSCQKRLTHNILFSGRLGEPVKQALHALQICKKLADEFPDVKIIFAGDFRHREDKEKFYASISDLGLESHVVIRGWQSDMEPLYRECSILLSTSFTESFGLSLVEAQAHGLPCIIYEMPIMPAWQNESIISVPQGNPEMAAEEISKLYRHPDVWLGLAEIAVQKSKRFSKELWDEKILSALSNFAVLSPWNPVSKDTMKKIILALSFYACTTAPKY